MSKHGQDSEGRSGNRRRQIACWAMVPALAAVVWLVTSGPAAGSPAPQAPQWPAAVTYPAAAHQDPAVTRPVRQHLDPAQHAFADALAYRYGEPERWASTYVPVADAVCEAPSQDAARAAASVMAPVFLAGGGGPAAVVRLAERTMCPGGTS